MAPKKRTHMAKYRGAHLDNLDDQEKQVNQEISESMMAQADRTPVRDPEEETYRKRYGDIRTHLTNLTAQKDNEIGQLKQQLEQATKAQIRFPKTDAEIEAWSAKYPDVSKIVDTIAAKRANEAMEALDAGEKRLQQLETRLSKKDAEQQLHHLHPDFNDIRKSEKFHEWVTIQPQSIQDALYKNNTDALSAARAIDLYKADTKTKTTNRKSAAESVGRTSSTRPSEANSGGKFSESQINSMSAKEYEKSEDAIMEAMRSGNFVYDMSGAAR